MTIIIIWALFFARLVYAAIGSRVPETFFREPFIAAPAVPAVVAGVWIGAKVYEAWPQGYKRLKKPSSAINIVASSAIALPLFYLMWPMLAYFPPIPVIGSLIFTLIPCAIKWLFTIHVSSLAKSVRASARFFSAGNAKAGNAKAGNAERNVMKTDDVKTSEAPTLNDAIILAARAHRGQVDKAGQPYILHPIRLMLSLTGEQERMAALLHDVVEDSDVTLGDLTVAGYPVEVVEAVALLTHREGVEYSDYIERIKGNTIARRVKLADLRDNLDVSRISSPTEKDRERMEKYQVALKILGEESG
jgi:guanosine-3',5'-bis(diphosphate) 3'-pyrophosphohydrolase